MERKMKQLEQREIFKASNEELVQAQVVERSKEVLNERKIEEYGRKKEALEKLRRDKEE